MGHVYPIGRGYACTSMCLLQKGGHASISIHVSPIKGGHACGKCMAMHVEGSWPGICMYCLIGVCECDLPVGQTTRYAVLEQVCRLPHISLRDSYRT